jgi:DNA topoisomerase IB
MVDAISLVCRTVWLQYELIIKIFPRLQKHIEKLIKAEKHPHRKIRNVELCVLHWSRAEVLGQN